MGRYGDRGAGLTSPLWASSQNLLIHRTDTITLLSSLLNTCLLVVVFLISATIFKKPNFPSFKIGSGFMQIRID